MLIESIIRRVNGHVVNLDNDTYIFKAPDYACEVVNQKHLQRFANIPEGYREKDAPAKTWDDVKPEPDPEPPIMSAIADFPVRSIFEVLDELTEAQLTELYDLEIEGKGRQTVINAIEKQVAQRGKTDV
jgi:hypothetical protein